MNPLKAGDIAPKFSLPDQDGEQVNLTDFQGQRVLVYFYPKAMTPGCTVQACGLRDNMDELKKAGVDVLGISTDKPEKLSRFAEKELLNFTLLSDEDHQVCEQFGVWGEKSFMGKTYDGIHRISFLIDADGKIEHVFDDFKTSNHHDVVLNWLKELRILVTGVASKLSIAYGIAQAMHREGAELAFTYQNDKLKGRVEEFAAQLGSDIVLQCDVAEDASIDTMFAELGKVWPKFDGFVHSIGFAPGDQLDGDYVNAVTREGFKIAHDISSYSFVAMAKACRSMLNPGSALLTLSYLGAERAIPNYNVMGLAKASLEANVRYMANAMGPEGVRVNAISAGPIRTLAASGIKDFRKMLAHCEAVTPIRRTVTIEDVGNSAAFLCSDLSAGISGEVVHVDGGFSIAAMNELELK